MARSSLGLPDGAAFALIRFVGDASTSMVLSLLFALWTMGFARKIPMQKMMSSCADAIAHIGMMLLIIGGGGALKQVFIEGGVGKYVAQMVDGSAASPLLFAWCVAAILRVSLGSATVAAISTAGLVIPMLASHHANLALVALATGAGSATFSHVNDAGFWMFKECFGLSMKETFGTWSILCTIVSLVGLVGVLVLERFVRRPAARPPAATGQRRPGGEACHGRDAVSRRTSPSCLSGSQGKGDKRSAVVRSRGRDPVGLG